MSWMLWIDDDAINPDTPARHCPNDDNVCWRAATTSDEAYALVKTHGLPSFIDFDHDLGGDDTAMKFLRRMEYETDLIVCNDPPLYNIHSANPNGRDNIRSFMESWKKVRSSK